jgi:hypothetical protein
MTLLLPPPDQLDPAPWRTTEPFPPTPAPARQRASRGVHRRRRQKVGAALALLVVAAWIISSFWVSVQFRSPRQPYLAPTASQQWARSPAGGVRAFFRLQFPVSTTMPQSITLWVEGYQQVTPYVDAVKVALASAAPNNLVDTAPDVPKVVQTVDIRPDVSPGINAVGLEVVSLNGQIPAFRARVEIRTGSSVQVYGVSPSSWESTTNAALTGQSIPQSGAFAKRFFDDGNWSPAVGARARPGTATVVVPPAAYVAPAEAPALTGTFGARSLIASTVVTFPGGCTDGWLRVAATGPYTVSLDGRAIATGGPGLVPGSLALSIFDLCPVASPGRHVLTVAVAASQRPVAYVDGSLTSGSSVVTFATGPGWHTGYGTSSGAPSPQVGTLNTPESALGVTFQRVPGMVNIPGGPLFADHLFLALELLGVALLAVVVALLLGLTPRRAVTAVLCGTLPAVGLVLLLTETRHIVYVQAPFPSTPFMLELVLGLAGVGVVSALGASVWAATRARRLAGIRPSQSPVHDDLHSRRRLVQAHWYAPAIALLAAGWSLVQSYRITFNPLWQDELSSLAAAQGIRSHFVPEWPSGFLYWKSELFSALIAVIGGISHDNQSVLREVSVVWFGATILVFGLKLAPLVLRGRRVYQLLATVVFATAPFEMGHALDIRMYQMLQFVVVVVAVLLLRALRRPSTKNIAWLMVAVVAMYFTHEESFGVLPVIPLALLCSSGLRWVRNWRWWAFGGLAVLAICVQLALAKFTHPPFFGVDPSGGPLVQWSPQPFYYLTHFFFADPTYGASITVVSSLAVVGAVVGLIRRDPIRLFLAAFWIAPTAVVSLVLLTKDTRYVFLCLPFVFALAACGTVDLIDGVRRVALRGAEVGRARMRRVLVELMAALSVVAIMLSLIGGLNDYGTWTGTLFHANVSHRWLDYPTAVSYVKAHMEPGDIVIADSSAPNLVGYSLGRAPNYWIPPHRTETLLYVFEKDDRPVDTQYGIPVLLNSQTFLSALDGAHRAWLVGDSSLIRGLLPSIRTIVQQRFSLQEEGESVTVLLATNA